MPDGDRIIEAITALFIVFFLGYTFYWEFLGLGANELLFPFSIFQYLFLLAAVLVVVGIVLGMRKTEENARSIYWLVTFIGVILALILCIFTLFEVLSPLYTLAFAFILYLVYNERDKRRSKGQL